MRKISGLASNHRCRTRSMLRKSAGAWIALMLLLTQGLIFSPPDALAQNLHWIRQFGTAGSDTAKGVVVDGMGFIYVVGSTDCASGGLYWAGGCKAFLRKYDPKGNVVWDRTFSSSGTTDALSVAVGTSGSIYVAGRTEGALGDQTALAGYDSFVRKYDSGGNEVWTRQFGSTNPDMAFSIATDREGNVYVGGDWGEFPEFYLLKLDANGNQVWILRSDWNFSGVATDGTGNVYAVGDGYMGDLGWNGYVRKYDPQGNELWTDVLIASPQPGMVNYSFVKSVAVDSTDNVYIAGYAFGPLPDQPWSGYSDVFVRKYASSGQVIWTREFGGTDTDIAYGVAVDGSNNAYVAGSLAGPMFGQVYLGGSGDAFVRKYDPDGNSLWMREVGTSQGEIAYGVAVDSQSSAYIAGVTDGALPGQILAGSTDAFLAKINDVASIMVSPITVSQNPVQVTVPITASATFTDPDPNGGHSAFWNWGDGSYSPGAVAETNGAGAVESAHTYSTVGIYTLQLAVTDNDDGSGLGQSTYQYVVVYDASGGFATGAGLIDSPPGAFSADPGLTGKATFGFVSKYAPGATVPTGQTQFRFQMAGLSFSSTSYQWLVVSGAKAQFKGSGTINGSGDYSFLLTATDGQATNRWGADLFRIKIWDANGIVYDNQMNAPDTADPTTVLVSGNIVVQN